MVTNILHEDVVFIDVVLLVEVLLVVPDVVLSLVEVESVDVDVEVEVVPYTPAEVAPVVLVVVDVVVEDVVDVVGIISGIFNTGPQVFFISKSVKDSFQNLILETSAFTCVFSSS